jgi:hypothetical protein
VFKAKGALRPVRSGLNHKSVSQSLDHLGLSSYVATHELLFDDRHFYDAIQFTCIYERHDYSFVYRYRGHNDTSEPSSFLRDCLAGDAPSDVSLMNLSIEDRKTSDPLAWDLLIDEPYSKLVEVYFRQPLEPGQSFDIEISGRWCGAATRREDYFFCPMQHYKRGAAHLSCELAFARPVAYAEAYRVSSTVQFAPVQPTITTERGHHIVRWDIHNPTDIYLVQYLRTDLDTVVSAEHAGRMTRERLRALASISSDVTLPVLNTQNGTYVPLGAPPTPELLKLMGSLIVGDRPYGKFRGSGGASIFAKGGRSVTAPCPNTGWESWVTQQLQLWLGEDAQAVEKLLTAMASRDEFLDAVNRVREADRKTQIEIWNGFLAPHGRQIVMTASGASVEFPEPTFLSAESATASAPTPAAASSARRDALVTKSEPRTHVFVSYSHQDAEWLKRLQIHLKPLIRQGALELWDDSRIKPGAAWRDEIEVALSRASVAVLLVSADFLASDFVADNELPPLLDRAVNGGVRIMSVIVGPCLFQHHSELSKYQAVNAPSLPLTKMQRHEAEETLAKLAQTIAEFTGS